MGFVTIRHVFYKKRFYCKSIKSLYDRPDCSCHGFFGYGSWVRIHLKSEYYFQVLFLQLLKDHQFYSFVMIVLFAFNRNVPNKRQSLSLGMT